jgi:hypothetical protein
LRAKVAKAAPLGLDGVEADLFGHMVLALDNYFCHRLRAREDNPLNRVWSRKADPILAPN